MSSYLYSLKSQSHCLSGLYNLYSERHPLSSEPLSEGGDLYLLDRSRSPSPDFATVICWGNARSQTQIIFYWFESLKIAILVSEPRQVACDENSFEDNICSCFLLLLEWIDSEPAAGLLVKPRWYRYTKWLLNILFHFLTVSGVIQSDCDKNSLSILWPCCLCTTNWPSENNNKHFQTF